MGLINDSAPVDQQQPAPQQGATPQPGGEPEIPPAPGLQGADQQAYERVVMAAMKVIYDPTSGKQILDMLRNAASPAEGLAEATYTMMQEFLQISKNTMPKQVIVPAGKEIMQLIAEMAVNAGIAEGPQVIQQAQQIIMKKMMAQANMTPEQAQQLAQQRKGQAPQQYQPVVQQ